MLVSPDYAFCLRKAVKHDREISISPEEIIADENHP